MAPTSSNTASSALPQGTKLQSGALIIGKVLGQGGFGITYHSGDVNLRRYIAVKEFFPPNCYRNGLKVMAVDAQGFEKAKAVFIEEARALARFNHRAIARILSIFEENDTAYMVMEFLKGKTLQQTVEERGVLTEGEALSYIEQISEALEVVHGAKIIHRDLKPENIILCENNRVVLVDFGLHKQIETARSYKTRQLTAPIRLGTQGYSPPEQYLQNAQLGTFTDIYALGATLYFLVTGQAPVSAPERAMGELLLPPQRLNPSLSPALNAAVMQAMEIKSDQRPQTSREFLDLMRPGRKLPIASGPVSATPRKPPVPKVSAASNVATNQFNFRKTRWGMTKAQVRAAEGQNPIHEGTDLLVYSGFVAGLSCEIIFIFALSFLVRAKYLITEQHSVPNTYLKDFSALQNALTEKYGQPESDKTYWGNDLFRDRPQDWGLAFSRGDCSTFVKWRDGKTSILLFLTGDNYEIELAIDYTSQDLKHLEEKKNKQQNLEDL